MTPCPSAAEYVTPVYAKNYQGIYCVTGDISRFNEHYNVFPHLKNRSVALRGADSLRRLLHANGRSNEMPVSSRDIHTFSLVLYLRLGILYTCMYFFLNNRKKKCHFMDGSCLASPRWVSLLVAELFYPHARFPATKPGTDPIGKTDS